MNELMELSRLLEGEEVFEVADWGLRRGRSLHPSIC